MVMKKWNKFYLKWCDDLAAMSKDKKIGVGCVITSLDRKYVFSIGINGGPSGGSNKRESMKSGYSGFVHAEQNAATKCLVPFYVPKIVYVSHIPCDVCSKLLVNLGNVKEVWYSSSYPSRANRILSKAGIKLCSP
jgi:dCMP deaminase